MANPIKTSDLFENTGEFKRLLAELEKVQVELERLQKQEIENAKNLEAALKNTTKTTRKQKEELTATAKQAAEIEKRYEAYNASLSENARKIAALKLAQQQINSVNKLTAKLNASAEGSYNKLSAQYSLNKIRLNQLSKAERETTEEGKKLVKQSAAIYEEMKRLQKETGKAQLNVGNYKDSVKAALGELDQMPGALGKFSSGLKGVGSQAKKLLRNPLLLFLAAIVGALAALGSAFTKSEKGAILMAKATGILNGFMSQLVDVSVSVAEFVTKAFEDPQQAVKDLGSFIVDNILNRFKAIPLIAKAALDALNAVWERDMSKLKDAGEDAFFAVNQAITGLDEEQIKSVSAAVVELVDEVNKETAAFIRLEEQKLNITRANRGLVRSIENLITKEQLSQAIADDRTKSFKEREEAAEAARAATEKRAKAEIQLAKNNLSVINQELALRRANGELVETLLDAQLGAYREVIAAERDYTLSVRDNEKTRNELKQDRLERDLDILLDGSDNQKTINERLLKDEDLTFSKRAEILEKTQKEEESSFKKKAETIQQFTGVAIDANELVATSDAVLLNEKIRGLGLSEIIEGRLLEVIRDRRTATLDLIEAEKELIKERNKNLNVDISILPKFDREAARFKEFEEKAKGEIAKIKRELEDDGSEPTDIFGLLGIDTGQGTGFGIKTAMDIAKQQLTEFANFRAQIAAQNVAQSNSEVQSAQAALDAEIQRSGQGLANSIDTKEKELAAAKKTQREALKEQERAQKAQLAAQSIEQAGNLITASSKIFSKVGFPLALPLIALMWGAFAASKVRAAQLTKKQFGKGTYEVVGGGSHASGNDTFAGFQSGGRDAYVERGEGVAVIPRTKTQKYKSILPEVMNSLINGNFEDKFQRLGSVSDDAATINGTVNVSTDNSGIEQRLDRMVQQNERQYFRDPSGNLVERYKNTTRIYV